MPEHRVEAIANEFLFRARRENRSLTNMQLQKLPYIAHGWAMALIRNNLIRDEARAYPYGPVYPPLYDALKRYGSGNVTDYIHERDGHRVFREDERGPLIEAALSGEEASLIDAVWDAYKGYHAFKLSEMTHQAGSPWTITTEISGTYSRIPNDLIRTHYENLAQQRRSAA